jgi:hypothetical protein
VIRKQLSFANVIASVALFIALGGTAVAAATLTRDSVGSAQIREGAVRSSDIRDDDIKVGDIATGAETALRSEVRLAQTDDTGILPKCPGTDLTACRNLLALRLKTDTGDDGSAARGRPPAGGPVDPEPGRNYLIQAKLTIDVLNFDATEHNRCGLVIDQSSAADTVLDEARFFLAQNQDPADTETIALTAVFSDNRVANPRIALRCTEQRNPFEEFVAEDVKMTALEVGDVIGQ